MQTGIKTSGAYDKRAAVTFSQAYKDTNYTITMAVQGQSHWIDGCMWYDKSTTGFGIAGGFQGNGTIASPTCWRTEGYIR